MKIKVVLISMEGEYPSEFDSNGEAFFEVEEGTTLDQLWPNFSLDKDQTYVVLNNGHPIPPKDRPQLQLNDDDELSIFPPLEGG